MHSDLDSDTMTVCISYSIDKNPHNVYIFSAKFGDFLKFNQIYREKSLRVFEPFSFNVCLERNLDSMIKRGLNDYPLVTMTRHC